MSQQGQETKAWLIEHKYWDHATEILHPGQAAAWAIRDTEKMIHDEENVERITLMCSKVQELEKFKDGQLLMDEKIRADGLEEERENRRYNSSWENNDPRDCG